MALVVGLGVGIGAGFGIWGSDEKTTPVSTTTAKPNACLEIETEFKHNKLGTFKALQSSVKSFKYNLYLLYK